MRIEDISELPPQARQQILKKLAEQKKAPAPEKRAGKYGNVQTEVDGIRFDSKKEAKRFLELRAMLDAGEITDLRLQRNFTLLEGYTRPTGERVRGIVYKADFAYYRKVPDGDTLVYVVEDVKSRATRTKTYEIKKKLMREKLGIEIQEI